MARSREHGAGGVVSGGSRALAPVGWLSRLGAARGLGRSGVADGLDLPPGRPASALRGVSSS